MNRTNHSPSPPLAASGLRLLGEADALKLRDLIEAALKFARPAGVVALDTTGRRKLLKPRAGGMDAVPEVEQLARQLHLEVPGASLDDMLAALGSYQRSVAIVAAARALEQAASDSLLQSQSAAWSSATLYYTILGRIARQDPHLQVQMERLNRLFARRSAAVRDEQVLTRAQRKAIQASENATKASQAADDVVARRKRAAKKPSEGQTSKSTESSNNAVGANGHA